MAQIMETVMLVCFGFSWPLAVYKNIKAKSAKGMSLNFILLIIVGYVAGIIAKISTNTFNFVFVVYLINLAIVSVNLVVYFINLNIDRKNAIKTVLKEMDDTMTDVALSDEILKETEKIKEENKYINKNEIVLFGGKSFSTIDINEVCNDLNINAKIYNRSINGLSLREAIDVLKPCVYDLQPKKLFINLGEKDLENKNFNTEKFISEYRCLLNSVNLNLKTKIYVVSLIENSNMAVQINKKLKALAKEAGAEYADINDIKLSENPRLFIIKNLKMFLRDFPISFSDAMKA